MHTFVVPTMRVLKFRIWAGQGDWVKRAAADQPVFARVLQKALTDLT